MSQQPFVAGGHPAVFFISGLKHRLFGVGALRQNHRHAEALIEACLAGRIVQGQNNFIPFTKKWRVKLYLLNQSGEWDDKGIGYVFLANEVQDQGIEGRNDNSVPTQMVKKLIMLRENTQDFIFNIDIIEENLEFHNQRGTILTWKNEDTFEEDNIAISFQLKEGITEIFKNIKMIKGENVQEDDVFFEEESKYRSY